MIKTRKDLKQFIQADSKTRSGSNMLIKWVTRSDDYLPSLLVKCLRKYAPARPDRRYDSEHPPSYTTQ